MLTAEKLKRRVLIATATGVWTLVSFELGIRLVDFRIGSFATRDLVVFDVMFFGAPIVGLLAGYYIGARRTRGALGKQVQGRPLWARAAVVVLALAYSATWIVGIPAVISKLATEASEEQTSLNERRASRGDTPSAAAASVVIRVAFAPLPGLVIVHAETRNAGFCDWCGWSLFVVAPGYIKQLGTRLHWIT
ncbi:MAG: hypothetical protein U0X73_07965 [Thermoanaerobaculia bacterium]